MRVLATLLGIGVLAGSACPGQETQRDDTSLAVAALAESLGDEDASVRMAAAEALGSMGPEAEAAIPELVELARDPDGYVRGTAARVLVRIGPAAVPGLAGLLQDGNPKVRRIAAQAQRFLAINSDASSPTD